ncbi:MAG: isoprenylcysteine carboxylmethyltransferase family protein [Actinobacteria bacterium]|nr:isoprenylcysteine carboxylmethyltransferase family protein [Actinomycetota bacterium]MBV8395367.1 isoprenylcysteine carboxylmethyltransferase family protein [Actinomycetota bacterium]
MSRIPDLGRRGGGWVFLQSILFVAVAAMRLTGVRWPHADRAYLLAAGLALVVAGIALFAAARVVLGRAFTPFPRPRENGGFRDGGPYRVVRHPIYAAVLLIAVGYALARAPLAFVPTALLAIVFDLKARREEAWLAERYPEYDGYRRRTSRFLPFLY